MPKGVIAFIAALAACLGATGARAIPIVPMEYSVELYATGLGAVSGVVFGPDGSLVVSDYGGGRILKVDSNGAVETLASGLTYIVDSVFRSDGTLFAATSVSGSSSVYQIAADGTATPYVAGFSYPASMAVWNDELYVANSGNGTISTVDALGNVSNVLSGLSAPNGPIGISFDSAGRMYFIDHLTGAVFVYDFLSAPELISHITAYGGTDTGIAFGGDLFVADVNLGALLRIDSTGNATTFATGFAGKVAPPVIGPHDFLYDGAGHMYVGDGNDLWKITDSRAVPEPDTFALIATGLLALLYRRRCRGGGTRHTLESHDRRPQ